MISFTSTNKNDLALSAGGSLTPIGGFDAIAQTARQYMQARRFEMFLNASNGMPFESVAWGGSPNVAQFEAAGRATLMQVPGVLSVTSFTARIANDAINYEAVIVTDVGEGAISG